MRELFYLLVVSNLKCMCVYVYKHHFSYVVLCTTTSLITNIGYLPPSSSYLVLPPGAQAPRPGNHPPRQAQGHRKEAERGETARDRGAENGGAQEGGGAGGTAVE